MRFNVLAIYDLMKKRQHRLATEIARKRINVELLFSRFVFLFFTIFSIEEPFQLAQCPCKLALVVYIVQFCVVVKH